MTNIKKKLWRVNITEYIQLYNKNVPFSPLNLELGRSECSSCPEVLLQICKLGQPGPLLVTGPDEIHRLLPSAKNGNEVRKRKGAEHEGTGRRSWEACTIQQTAASLVASKVSDYRIRTNTPATTEFSVDFSWPKSTKCIASDEDKSNSHRHRLFKENVIAQEVCLQL